ncbi:MAG: tetratricopeptide repeat protein [Fibrobacterales bacterium]
MKIKVPKPIVKIWKRLSRAERNLIKLFSIALLGILVFVLGILKIYTDISHQQMQPEEYTQEVEHLIETGQESLIDSIELIADIITEIDPEDIDAHMKLIEIYKQAKEYHKILPHIERIEPFNSDDLDFLTNAGKAFYASGKPKEAIRYLKDAHLLNPDDPDIAMELYLAEFKVGMINESLKKLHDLQSQHPRNPKLATFIGTIQAELNVNAPEAKEQFEKAIELDPNYAQAWYQYGRMNMNQGNFGEAKLRLKKSVLMDPLNPKFNARLGMAYFYLREDKNAEYSYRTALALNDQDYNTHYNLGELYLSWSDDGDKIPNVRINIQKALESYLQCLELSGEHHFSHYKVGMILNGNGQYKEAIQHLTKTFEVLPHYVPALLQLAIAHEHLNMQQEAKHFYTKAYEEDPFNRIILQKYKKFTMNDPKTGVNLHKIN